MSQTAGYQVIISGSFCANSSCNSATTGVTPSITDTAGGNTYTQISRIEGSTSLAAAAVVNFCGTVNATGGNQITWTNSPNTTQYLDVAAFEISGGASCASILDQIGTGQTNTATSSPYTVSTSGTTTQANELAYTVITSAGTITGYPSGWTGIQNSYNNNAYQAVPSSGTTVSAGWPFSGTLTGTTVVVLTLKPASSSATTPPIFVIQP